MKATAADMADMVDIPYMVNITAAAISNQNCLHQPMRPNHPIRNLRKQLSMLHGKQARAYLVADLPPPLAIPVLLGPFARILGPIRQGFPTGRLVQHNNILLVEHLKEMQEVGFHLGMDQRVEDAVAGEKAVNCFADSGENVDGSALVAGVG